MEQENNQMGIMGIPFTFPTMTVMYHLDQELPAFKWTAEKVNNIYLYYKDAVENGFEPYGEGGTPLVEHVKNESGYSLGEVRGVLSMIRILAKDGDIGLHFWKQDKPDSSFSKSTENFISENKDAIGKIGSIIKWGGIGIATIGVLYVTWPIIKKFRG